MDSPTSSSHPSAFRSPHAFGDEDVTNASYNASLKVGDRVVNGRYEILSELGQGGMGTVFLCRDTIADVELALKTLPPLISQDPEAIRDVRQNFKLAARLVHQNIAVYRQLEYDGESGRWFVLMEQVKGESLAQWIVSHKTPEGGVSLEEAVKVLRQVASVLDYAHGMNVLHRDIKPSNIMVLPDGSVKVLDFGLAVRIDPSLSCTHSSQGTGGTLGYMAPEQDNGGHQTAATDQYSLAVVAFEMLSGRRYLEVLREAMLSRRPLEVPGVSEETWQALLRGMAEKPENRFPNCTAFVDALEGKIVVESVRPDAVPAQQSAQEEDQTENVGNVDSSVRESVSPVSGSPKSYKKVIFIVCLVLVVGLGCLIGVRTVRSNERTRKAEEPFQKVLPGGVVTLPGGGKLEMIRVKAGSFMMGSPETEKGRDSDEIQHRVTLTKDYWLGKFEVTQEQWQAVMGSNPSDFKGPRLPVENVSWYDANAFCQKLNELYGDRLPSGYRFGLPTEAQWEYACRAGSAGSYGGGSLDAVGWYGANSGHKTHEVGTKQPNAWGFCDMHGNVCEWCSDWYDGYSGNATDPKGPASGSCRVLRGGSWGYYARDCRSANRYYYPSNSDGNYGFRVVLLP